jgi:phage major head subunit gpT-like protein
VNTVGKLPWERGEICQVDVNVFTQMMRAEFINSMQAVGEPAPIEQFATTISSTGRIENYPWMSPAPGIGEYKGHRRLGQMDPINYSLLNREYDGAFEVNNRDIRDDKVGGYNMRMKDLALKAKSPFRSRNLLQTLAGGKTGLCFDGSYFFATTHTLGGYATSIPGTVTNQGGNLLGWSCTTSDSTSHRIVVMVNEGPLKPLIFQNRQEPEFDTDSGTKESTYRKKTRYWIDLEAAFGYGYWWDAVMVEITNTPTFTEMQNILSAARQALRQFTLPKAKSEDANEYIHEQLEFKPDNTAVVCSTGLETVLDAVLNNASVGISVPTSTSGISSNNNWYKKFTLLHSNYLNP